MRKDYKINEAMEKICADDNATEFVLTYISEPDARFKDVDWKRYK